jgi:hypothetical protein
MFATGVSASVSAFSRASYCCRALTEAVLPIHIDTIRELNQSIERTDVGQATFQINGEAVVCDVTDEASSESELSTVHDVLDDWATDDTDQVQHRVVDLGWNIALNEVEICLVLIEPGSSANV